jgi:allophanate hydrolase subunit 2
MLPDDALCVSGAALKKTLNAAAFTLKHPLKMAGSKINHGCGPVAAAKHSYLAFKAGFKFSLFEGEQP